MPPAHDTPAAAPAPSDVLPGLALIAAVAANGTIGAGNRLPWRLPEDLRHFRSLTLGHAVIMGRRTWESLPQPLAGRQNIVITRSLAPGGSGAEAARSLDDALARVALPEPMFVIGGAQLYAEAMARAATLHLTEIAREYDGDTTFPPLDRSAWREVAREEHRAAADGIPFAFVTYVRAR
jgi:dihydrofolate reductase